MEFYDVGHLGTVHISILDILIFFLGAVDFVNDGRILANEVIFRFYT